MTKENKRLTEVSFAMMSNEHNELVLDDLFLLNDNLDKDLPLVSEEKLRQTKQLMPLKIMFTMVVTCHKGSIKTRINLMEYNLKSHDVLLITPNSIMELVDVEPGTRLSTMCFADGQLENELIHIAPIALRKYFLIPMLYHVSEDDMDDLTTIYRLMRKTIQRSKGSYAKEAILHYLQVLTCKFMEKKEEMLNDPSFGSKLNRQQEILYDFMQAVHDNCADHRDLKFYADKLCLSTAYLAHVISEVSGRHASMWIRDSVILEAKAMLRNKSCTVQQVSNALNFPNQSFFGKYFKAAVGCSPRQYQQGGGD